ncbi:hypothetical protein NHX12_007018 [Muraenolepis orangiensis]|uniref:BED-type domain-containing protein n=1 Tax=Muraenolepis orangiensis TaxID=630683 RepID=A0A9Q0DSL5_9TELE|nr:hypothetical protein NHX12_007018 [Muraenolepis orangiensis]
MGRHQVNPIRQFFTFEPASNKSFCQIVGCEAKIAGNHGGNLQRHIEKKHPSTFKEIQRQHGLERPPGDGGHTSLHSVEEGEEEDERTYEYDPACSTPNIFSHYRSITPPDLTEQASLAFRLKGESDEDLLSNDLPPRALRHDVVLKQFTDIMLADMQQIEDPLLLIKLRRDITDLVFKAVEEDAKRSHIGSRKELYCPMLPHFQMSSEPCSSGGGPSSYLKTSRKQRRANRSQRMLTGGGGGRGGRGGGRAGEEWSDLNSSVTLPTHQVKAETESLEEMEIPALFPPINLEGNNKG